MKNDDETLVGVISQLLVKHAGDQGCFVTCEVDEMKSIKGELLHLAGKSLRGARYTEREGDRVCHIKRRCTQLQRKWDEHERHRRFLQEALKYDPGQPRVPAGSSDGGEWTETGAGAGSSRTERAGVSTGYQPAKDYHAARAADHAVRHAYSPTGKKPYGNGECAAKVRAAVEAGLGYSIPSEYLPPMRTIVDPETGKTKKTRWAKDYGDTFYKVGMTETLSVMAGVGTPPSSYSPKIGDVVVIQPISNPLHPEGHTAIYTEEGWFSDYKQEHGFYPNATYRREKPSYVIYRKPE